MQGRSDDGGRDAATRCKRMEALRRQAVPVAAAWRHERPVGEPRRPRWYEARYRGNSADWPRHVARAVQRL